VGSKGYVRLDLLLTLDDGSQLLIPVGSKEFAEARTAVLYERVREIVDDRAPAGSPPPVLARGGKTAREWIASLRALGRERSYRAASVDEVELARVVETATMSAEERAAAAVALARDAAGRERVRIAANAVVAPHLRVALDAVASGDDDALESAMEALAKGDSV